jgi:hypothetical protein
VVSIQGCALFTLPAIAAVSVDGKSMIANSRNDFVFTDFILIPEVAPSLSVNLRQYANGRF